MHMARSTAAAAVVFLVSTGSALAAASGGKATGGVNYLGGSNYDYHRSFTAQEVSPTVAKGQVETKVIDPATGQVVRRFHGNVDCYRRVSDNVAIFSGQIDNDQGPVAEAVEGQFFEWVVEDNGEGANAAPDRISALRGITPYNCKADVVPVRDVVNGNIQVK